MATSFSVSGSITVRRLRTGASLSLTLITEGALIQVVNTDTGEVTPDWGNGEHQPTVTPEVIVTPSEGAVSVSLNDDKQQGWWYNSTLLKFTGSKTTVDGWTIDTTGNFALANDGTFALRIIGNLASKENYASDTLQFTCTVEYQDAYYDMSASTVIMILPGGTSGYTGFLSATTQILNETYTTSTITALLVASGGGFESSFSTVWYKGQVDEAHKFGDEIKTTTGYVEVEVNRDDVNGGDNNDDPASGGTLFICQFYNSDGSLVATRGINIVDEADEYSCDMGISSQSLASTLDAGDVTVQAAIYSTSRRTIVKDYTDASFDFFVLNGDFASVREANGVKPDANGYATFVVTADDSTDGNDVMVRCDATFTLPTYTT